MSSFSLSGIDTDVDIVIDPFCLRQFESGGNNPAHIPIPCDPNELVIKVNHFLQQQKEKKNGQSPLADGYAPFCKHLFLPNFLGDKVRSAYVAINAENEKLLVSKYVARTEKELPVLSRHFEKSSVTAPAALYLDIILYSREQIFKENAAMASKQPLASSTVDKSSLVDPALSSSKGDQGKWTWGIVSIKPQLVDYETPMAPITIMRNALGVEEGGSGIPLDREAYMKSVEFWSKHANII